MSKLSRSQREILAALTADRAEFVAKCHKRRIDRMDAIDRLPQDVRACVHDYGWRIVDTCRQLGLTKANHIRHIVETILDESSPTRGTHSAQGIRTPFIDMGEQP